MGAQSEGAARRAARLTDGVFFGPQLGWTDVARFVRETDGFHRPVTVHPTTFGREQVTDPRVLDFEMLQTGHGGWKAVPHTAETVRAAIAREPRMPVVNAEVNYEGILEGSRQEIQRVDFWACMLSGAAGFTYGANGIWQASSTERPYPPSTHGATWGKATWADAMRLPGSAHVGVGKRILERCDWRRFQPHQDWVSPSAGPDDWFAPYAAGIPGECRVIYFPSPIMPWGSRPRVLGLEPGVSYKATFIDPKDETLLPAGEAQGDSEGKWQVPQPNVMQDWVLALERVR